MSEAPQYKWVEVVCVRKCADESWVVGPFYNVLPNGRAVAQHSYFASLEGAVKHAKDLCRKSGQEGEVRVLGSDLTLHKVIKVEKV